MGEVLVLQCVYLCSYIVWGVGWQYRALCLEECGALVIVLVNKVDGDSALGVTALDNCLVHSVAIHALAAMLGEQCGVDVDYAAGVGCNELLWNKQQKTGKHNKIDENYQSECEKIRFENFVEIGDERYGNEKENYAEKVCTNGEKNGENHKNNNEKIGGKTEKINNI